VKITHTSIHQVKVETTCGCCIAQNYADRQYQEPQGSPTYDLCQTHQPLAGPDNPLEVLLLDMLDNEVKRPQVEPTVISPMPTIAWNLSPVVPGDAFVPAPDSVAPAAASAATPRAERPTRPHRPDSAGPRQPTQHRPVRSSESGASPYRSDGMGKFSSNAAAALAERSGRRASHAVSAGVDIPDDDFDPRIANLLERTGFIDGIVDTSEE
jgi:hypothetical protein